MRSRLGLVAAFTALTVASPSGAAEITQIATSAEKGNPFDFHFSLRWDRTRQKSSITRERTDATQNPPFGAIEDVKELTYTRTYNAVVPRVAVGLYQDVELHFEVPYVLADDRAWRGSLTTIEFNQVGVEGTPCFPDPADPSRPLPNQYCALFPVRATDTTVYHGGKAGDLTFGLAWGIFNDRKDDTKPFWLVGLDVTAPTASLHDPFAGRDAFWMSPSFSEGRRGAFGEKIWKYDLYTALSRRLGPMDPYFKAHVTGMFHSNDTYSNCLHAAEAADPTLDPQPQMTAAGAANCADPGWESDSEAKLPFVAGLTFGTELVPYENPAEQQKVSLDVRVWADYTSSQRFYNELTDMTGKLHQTEGHVTMGGRLGVYARASKNVGLQAAAALSTKTSHFLTGEDPGRGAVTSPGEVNPNYDPRYDAPGRRFRLSGTSIFDLSVAAVLLF